MPALQLISGYTSGITAAFTAITLAVGDTLQIKNSGGQIKLLKAWTQSATANSFQIKSPRFHDNVNGLIYSPLGTEIKNCIDSIPQSLVSQDTLLVNMKGSTGAGQINSIGMLVFYSSLKGSDGNFLAPSQVMARAVSKTTVQVTLALGTTGGYSGEVAINSTSDLLKANTEYAIVGYILNAKCASIGIRGTDTGNIRVGAPGSNEPEVTRNWFLDISKEYMLPLIPVINSANKANTLIDGVQDDGGVDAIVTLNLVELSK
jgi:hypothetical protein